MSSFKIFFYQLYVYLYEKFDVYVSTLMRPPNLKSVICVYDKSYKFEICFGRELLEKRIK